MIRIRGLRKVFGDRTAIDGLDLEVEPGEVFGLRGPNGAGKSTTVSCATGVLRPDGGSIELFGDSDPADPATRCRVGVAPQALALHDELTGKTAVWVAGVMSALIWWRHRENIARLRDGTEPMIRLRRSA